MENVFIDYREVVQAVRNAAVHGIDLSTFLLKGTQTESWTQNEAKTILLWCAQNALESVYL